MKDNSNKLKWIIPAILIAAALIIAVALRNNDLPYQLTVQETVTEAGNINNIVMPSEKNVINEKVVLVDLRDSRLYNLNHPVNAINIPSQIILTNDNIEILKEIEEKGNTIVLYGTEPRIAAGAWLLLRQVGFNNIKYYSGTFEQLISKEPLSLNSKNEIPLIDTTLLDNLKVSESTSPEPSKTKRVVPIRSAPKAEAGGGC